MAGANIRMNFDRIYEFRFKDVDPSTKRIVWEEVSRYISEITNRPSVVLDPASGMCEFVNSVQATEKWAVDQNVFFLDRYANSEVRKIVGNALMVELPSEYFDLIFVSNFLEHLESQTQVAEFLDKMNGHLKPGGYVAVMGPNFKFAYREYFDFADHRVALTEIAVAEHLVGAGFNIKYNAPRFLPLSFRGGLPVNRFLIRTYLKMRFAWPLFGKQFLVIGTK